MRSMSRNTPDSRWWPAWAALGLALLLVACGAGAAPELPAPLARGETVRVASVIDGDTVMLADGREVRLVGLQAPKLPLGRAGFEPWPLADEAKAALADLVTGRTVTLGYGGRREDRHGRRLAHLVRADGLWVQAEVVRRGMARVYSFADNRALVRELQALEQAARADGRGIWALDYYRIRSVREAFDAVGSFQLVVGRVLDAAAVNGRVYLNFGKDWRQDFTVSVSPGQRETFETAAFDLLDLEGRWIRVRGWIERYNGPMIEATHPEQIEVVK